jgi:hypothetical protein
MGHGTWDPENKNKQTRMEFLGLTGPILALYVEVDREACELRYAGPFLESHPRMLP